MRADDGKNIEFSSNIRYMDRHGRKAATPWSLRQTAVYQRLDFQSRKSTWVILQPPANTYQRLKNELGRQKQTEVIMSSNPMQLHLLFLSCTTANWKEYLSDLNKQLVELVSRPNIESHDTLFKIYRTTKPASPKSNIPGGTIFPSHSQTVKTSSCCERIFSAPKPS